MGYVYFELPDALVEEARAAGISIEEVAHAALNAALAGRGAEPHVPAARATHRGQPADAMDRYHQGRNLGDLWVRTLATVEEMAEIAGLRLSRWRDYRIDTTSHSLGRFLVEQGELDPKAAGRAWMARDSFAEGLVEAVADAAVKAERP